MAPKISFHKKENILSIRFSKSKSVDSDISGNVVIDYGKDGQLVNVDIMDINLQDFAPIKNLRKLDIKQIA